MRSSFRRVFVAVGLIAGVLVAAPRASAQLVQRAEQPRPVIVVSASAEVEVAPDRASFSVAVESRGRNAADAAAANARMQTAILDAIRRAGVPTTQIRTTALSVSPEMEYPREGGRPTIVGYQARNSVEVELRDLARIGAVLDAALSQGATNIAGPRFWIADDTPHRRQALENAVKKARAEAEAIAAAAGVRVGAILEVISGEAAGPGIPEMTRTAMFRADAAAATPIESGTLRVSASVTIRFAIQSQ